jgi:hypothetical protein
LPHLQGASWAKYLPKLHRLDTSTVPACQMFADVADIPAKALYDLFVVELRPPPGIFAFADLPELFLNIGLLFVRISVNSFFSHPADACRLL